MAVLFLPPKSPYQHSDVSFIFVTSFVYFTIATNGVITSERTSLKFFIVSFSTTHSLYIIFLQKIIIVSPFVFHYLAKIKPTLNVSFFMHLLFFSSLWIKFMWMILNFDVTTKTTSNDRAWFWSDIFGGWFLGSTIVTCRWWFGTFFLRFPQCRCLKQFSNTLKWNDSMDILISILWKFLLMISLKFKYKNDLFIIFLENYYWALLEDCTTVHISAVN